MMERFFESKLSLILILAVALVLSLSSPFFAFSRAGIVDALIGTPKYWFDEGFVVEAARNLMELGRLDIVVEPGTVSGTPYFVSGGGFPVSVPLAGVFTLFGAGVLEARIVAILWLLGALAGVFVLWRRMFGPHAAFWGMLLLATFAPLYANGKTITGEIPGFLFLVFSLYLIYYRKYYAWGGVFAALALATKPSIYLLIVPAFAFEFLLFERPFWRHAFRTAAGALPVVLLWLFIMFPNPLSPTYWQGALAIYTDHYPLPSLLSKLPHTWTSFLSGSTVLYLTALIAVFIGALFWKRVAFTLNEQRILWFIAFYGIVDIIYFLLSPGWFRYLLPLQLFLLLLLYPVLHALGGHPRKVALAPTVFLLALLQAVVFINFSDIKSGLDTPRLADEINRRLGEDPAATVGIINAIQASSLVSADRKFLTVDCGGGCRFGTHPLSVSPERLPTYLVVGRGDQNELEPFRHVLDAYYASEPEEAYGSFIYRKR